MHPSKVNIGNCQPEKTRNGEALVDNGDLGFTFSNVTLTCMQCLCSNIILSISISVFFFQFWFSIKIKPLFYLLSPKFPMVSMYRQCTEVMCLRHLVVLSSYTAAKSRDFYPVATATQTQLYSNITTISSSNLFLIEYSF